MSTFDHIIRFEEEIIVGILRQPNIWSVVPLYMSLLDTLNVLGDLCIKHFSDIIMGHIRHFMLPMFFCIIIITFNL